MSQSRYQGEGEGAQEEVSVRRVCLPLLQPHRGEAHRDGQAERRQERRAHAGRGGVRTRGLLLGIRLPERQGFLFRF